MGNANLRQELDMLFSIIFPTDRFNRLDILFVTMGLKTAHENFDYVSRVGRFQLAEQRAKTNVRIIRLNRPSTKVD